MRIICTKSKKRELKVKITIHVPDIIVLNRLIQSYAKTDKNE